MDISKFLVSTYILLFLLFIVIGTVIKVKINKYYYVLVILIAFSMSYFGFKLEPNINLDLYRLQQYIISNSFIGSNFLRQIYGLNSSYSNLFGFNLLCFFVNALGDVHWLSAISCFITSSIVLSILIHYLRHNEYDSRAILPAIALIFMGIQIQYIFSGIRNALAVSLIVLAIYIYQYNHKKKILCIIIIFLGVTIHPIAFVSIIAFFLAHIKAQTICRLATFFAVPVIFAFAQIIAKAPVSFLNYVGSRILFYKNTQYAYDRPEMIANALVFIIVMIACWYYKKRNIANEKNSINNVYINAYFLLGFAMLGCFGHRDFALRIGYFMGIGAVPIVLNILFKSRTKDKSILLIKALMCFVIFVCCVKVYYDTIVVLAQWNWI